MATVSGYISESTLLFTIESIPSTRPLQMKFNKMGNPRNGFDTSGMVTLYELLRKTGALSLTSEIRTMTGIFRRLPVAELVHDT